MDESTPSTKTTTHHAKKHTKDKTKKDKDTLNDNGLMTYLKDYLHYSEIRGYTHDTLIRRHSAIQRFIRWCDERDIHEPQVINKPILERYQRYLYYTRKPNGEPLAFATQQVLLSVLKSFMTWLSKENYILYNPAAGLDLPKRPRQLPRHVLHVEDVQRLLALPDVTTLEGIRDRAILETLYSTGIRRTELTRLEVYDIDQRRHSVLIKQGKGRKDRMVPIGHTALEWIEHYRLQVRAQLITRHDQRLLFVNDAGEGYQGTALSAKVKRYLQQANIHATGSCHLLRHAMATHMLDNGADIRIIQAILGHADLNTTQIYTHVSMEKISAVHRDTHPGNQTQHADKAYDQHNNGDQDNDKSCKQTLLALLNDEGEDE